MNVVPGPKRGPVAKYFTGGDLGKVPGKNTLVGEIIQVFEKYGAEQCLQGWHRWLSCFAALQRDNGKLRAIHKLSVRGRWPLWWLTKRPLSPAAEDWTQL